MGSNPGAYSSLDQLVDAQQSDSSSGFELGTEVPAVEFKLKGVPPPSPLLVSKDDVLRVVARSTAPGVTAIEVTARVLLLDGTMKWMAFVGRPVVNDRRHNVYRFSLPDCFVLMLEVNPLTTGVPANIARGELYIQVTLTRGDVASERDYASLVSAYMSDGCNPAWPGGRYEHSASGLGVMKVVNFLDPLPGAEALMLVPSGARWRVANVSARLATSAVAGNRTPLLSITMAGATTNTFFVPPFLGPSAAASYEWSPCLSLAQDAFGNRLAPFPPDLMLQSGDSLSTFTSGLDAADQYSQLFVAVEEWLEQRA